MKMKLGHHRRRAERGDESPFRACRSDEGRDLDRQRADELVRNSDSRNSVHEKMKHRTAVAATPPLHHRQHDACQKICKRVAPSIIAASSTSVGHVVEERFHQQHGDRQVDQGVDR